MCIRKKNCVLSIYQSYLINVLKYLVTLIHLKQVKLSSFRRILLLMQSLFILIFSTQVLTR